MELSISNIRRGGVKIGKTAQAVPAATKTKVGTASGDRLELSRAALNWVETLNDRNFQDQERRAALQQQKMADNTDLFQQMEGADDATEAEGESFRIMNRCMKIASNIMSGKRVPLKDLRYLMEHDSKLYQMAMAMRRPDKDDEKCDPVVKEDEESSSCGTTDAGADGAVSPPESSTGAETQDSPPNGGETAE